MSKNKKSTGKAGLISWIVVTAFLVAFLIVFTILAQGMLNPILTTVLGGKKPILADSESGYTKIYTSDYNSKKDAIEAGNKLNLEIEKEGAVLLLNEENALPLEKGSKVSVFGKNSVNLVLGGSGSGGGSGENAKTLFDGLKAGGFEYNETLKSFYEGSASGAGRSASPTLSEASTEAPTLDIGETPVKNYSSDVIRSFKEYSDAAIVVISRLGGESWDLPRSQNTANGGIADNHYLQLDQNEYDMLDMVTSRFEKVVVLLNTLTSFQCDFIDEYNNTSTDKRIDAVMWIGGPGANGAEAIGSLLNGDTNPSGKTVDIYSRNFKNDPTWQNFGDNSQTTENGLGNTQFMLTQTDSYQGGAYNMVTYEEGIYVGYRYYETRAFEEGEDNPDWYEKNVMFPFGYGLSYSTFKREIKAEGSLADGGSLTVTVKVTNVSEKDVAGKDAVQLYVSKPYYEFGIEKSHIELVDFAKTGLLKKGESAEVVFKVDAYDLASYDYNDANGNGFSGYELEAGDYVFYAGGNSHIWADAESYEKATVTLDEGVNWAKDPVTDNEVVNRYTFGTYEDNEYVFDNYDDLQYKLSDVWVGNEKRKGMSRTDFEGTFPTALTVEERIVNNEDKKDGYTEAEKLTSYDHNNVDIEKDTEGKSLPNTGKTESELILHDLLGEDGRIAWNNDKWDELLDKITFNEMLELVNNGAFQTVAIESIGKNLTNDSDGPIGFVNFLPGAISAIFADNNNFATEIVIGSTWNKDLAYQMGLIVGENGLWGDQSGNNSLPYSGWYAPGINLHRSPFSGRNFEYYSEDPVLTGKMAVNVVAAARTKGVYSDLKHFALNDQETNRGGVSTFCTEQALREIYLKPFELAVKGDEAPRTVKMVKDTCEDKVVEKYEGAIGVMSSFNRIGNKFTGGDYRLLTQILRQEWGFKGLVICDYKTSNLHMNSRQMLYAGNDLLLTSVSTYFWNDADANSVQDVTVLRNATKNILYTVGNSNSIQFKIEGYATEWWITLIIVLDCAIPVCLAIWGVFAVRKYLKNKKNR